jgi:hypothetical protein
VGVTAEAELRQLTGRRTMTTEEINTWWKRCPASLRSFEQPNPPTRPRSTANWEIKLTYEPGPRMIKAEARPNGSCTQVCRRPELDLEYMIVVREELEVADAEAMFLFGRYGVEADPVGARQQQSLAAAGAEQQPGFADGEAERVGDDVDGLWGLAQQDLGGGVGDDDLADVGAEQVADVLGDWTRSTSRCRITWSPWPAPWRRIRLLEPDRRDACTYVDEAHNFLNLPGSSGVVGAARHVGVAALAAGGGDRTRAGVPGRPRRHRRRHPTIRRDEVTSRRVAIYLRRSTDEDHQPFSQKPRRPCCARSSPPSRMELMGHRDVRSSQRYTHSNEARFDLARGALDRARRRSS